VWGGGGAEVTGGGNPKGLENQGSWKKNGGDDVAEGEGTVAWVIESHFQRQRNVSKKRGGATKKLGEEQARKQGVKRKEKWGTAGGAGQKMESL